MAKAQRRSAFTLIELLVVVAIIAVLISILLPALSAAREQGRAVVCLSNLKQVTTTFFLYAEDYKYIPGAYWQGPINLDWSGRNNVEFRNNPGKYKHPLETSVLRRYLSNLDKLLECPTARREANTLFDYTMIIRMAGARTDLPWFMTYPTDPTRSIQSAKRFQALPLLMEEDAIWYNRSFDDGSWANLDQITDRHGGSANLAYLDGSASRFKSPKGGSRETQDRQDLTARHLRLWVGIDKFPVWRSDATEFGWVNQPR